MVVAPTFSMLRDATLRTVFEIFPEGIYTFYRGDMRMKLVNGSEVLFRSTDEPDHLRGPNLAWVYMDEAAQSSEESFRVLQGRLRQEGMEPQLWITTTPKGFNWVYQEFAAKERSGWGLVRCSARDNPYLPEGFLDRLEASYAPEFALQEIEGEFTIVGGNAFFDMGSLRSLLDDCMEPREVRSGGVVRIWKRPVIGCRYVAGGDLAWGQTGAYSVLTVVDHQTGEQVAEIAGRLPPDEMAQASVQLCEEYNRAYCGVENNGEGMNIVKKMEELGYGGRMFHQDQDRRRKAETPGWNTNSKTRPMMLGELEEAVRNLQIRVRCKDAVGEMMSFVRDDRGTPRGSEGAHDDHVMSWAIAWQMNKYAKFVSGKRVPMPRLW